MAHDIFISYPSENKAVADAVCATLEGRKVRCWIAPRDVLAGRPYAEQIPTAIGQSRAMVLVFSGHANRSQHMMREVEIAINRGLAILPLRIEDVAPEGSLDYYLKTIHWLDALTPPFEAHLEVLADSVTRLLGSEPAPRERPTDTVAATPSPAVAERTVTRSLKEGWLPVVGFVVAVALMVALLVWVGNWMEKKEPAAGQPSDLLRLQGFWTQVASEKQGKRESMEEGDFEIEFRGNEMWAHERPHPPTGGPIIFRTDINPPGFDQIFEYNNDGKQMRGRITWIYRFLDENHLEMAYPDHDSLSGPSALIPHGFDSTKEDINIATFERKR